MTRDLKSAERLINLEINNTIKNWAQLKGGETYLIRHAKGSCETHIVIQPTYDNVFYGIGAYIQIAIACGCSFYVKCEENKLGILTPTLHIY